MAHPRLILAAKAVPRRGGQGLNFAHMLEALQGPFEVRAFCAETGEYAGTKLEAVGDSPAQTLMGRFPLVRRLRDWRGLLNNRYFDSFVAARIADRSLDADVFQGVTGQCERSLAAAKARGMAAVLDSVTAHIGDFAEHQLRECATFGIRPTLHRGQIAAAMREYESADLIRVMSEPSAESFARRGVSRERIVVVPPFMSESDFPEPANFSHGTFRVSFVGLIEPWKGFHYLIEGFNKAALPDAELVLWGGAGARPVARYLAEQQAKNPRIIVRAEEVRKVGLGEVYGKSSVLVHPSLTDGFGYVVAEAMASGIPVITTPNTGASQMIEDGKNGYIVPAADPDSIADRLRHLESHPELLPEMGRAARESAASLTKQRFRETFVPRIGALLDDGGDNNSAICASAPSRLTETSVQ
jgi:glycosyltransferase involved in cell wall biosynthesis